MKDAKNINNREKKAEEDPIEILNPVIINPKSEYIYCIIWLHGVDNFVKLFTDEIFKKKITLK